MTSDDRLAALRAELVNLGVADNVVLHVGSVPEGMTSPAAAINTVVDDAALRRSETWIELEPDIASHVVRDCLWRDLAYDSARMGKQQAVALAARFIELVSGEDARFFSPAEFTRQPKRRSAHGPHFVPHDWETETPTLYRPTSYHGILSSATFEAAVAGLCKQHVGLLLITDED